MLSVSKLRSRLFGPIDLEVDCGECVAVVGASGAGKSLLLRAIVDLDPNEGDVSWKTRSRNTMPAPEWRRLVGYVPAETGWWADQVVAHFESSEEALALFEAVGLPREAMGWDVARLSTGERHRLGLVRALLQKPDALLLDEPTAALDEAATRAVEVLVRRELQSGTAILLVTHDVRQAERLASRCLTIADGRIVDQVGAVT